MLCRCQLSSYILRAGFRRSQTALWRGRWVKIDKQSIRTCRARPVVITRDDKFYTNTSSSPSFHFLGLVVSVGLSVTAATFCENFGVTQKLSQTWACFTRCLGKSGKAAKANSCASDTRHALLYAPRHACVRMYHANWMCQRVLRTSKIGSLCRDKAVNSNNMNFAEAVLFDNISRRTMFNILSFLRQNRRKSILYTYLFVECRRLIINNLYATMLTTLFIESFFNV